MIAILTSMIGSGTYNPALLLKKKLEEKEIKCQFYILEQLYEESTLEKLKENKNACHKNFRVASLFMNLPKNNISASLNDGLAESLLAEWEMEEIDTFLVFSGFWKNMVAEYGRRCGIKKVSIFKMRMDFYDTPSWKEWGKENGQEIFLLENKNVVWEFFHKEEIIPWQQRTATIVVHGGGWGIGVDQNICNKLEKNHFALQILHLYREDFFASTLASQYYMGECHNIAEFPPLYDKNGEKLKATYYASHELIKRAAAIVLKPGGGTLFDSLLTATPLIYTKPVCRHEACNAAEWKKRGFGLSYEEWENTNFSMEVLLNLHKNLLEYRENNGI